MALPVERQLTYWGIAAAVLILALWQLGNVLMPFILGGAIAYCLDPIADWFEAKGFSRGASVGIVLTGIIVVIIPLLIVAVLTLVDQTNQLVAFVASVIANAPTIAQDFTTWIEARTGMVVDPEMIQNALTSVAQFLQSRSGVLASSIFNSVSGIVNVIVFFVLVPVITVYMLIDWDRMVASVDALLPRDHQGTLRQIARDIDKTLASFIRGQGTVCLILGLYYAIALMIVGLNFGFVIGVFAGLISFIPYIGALLGGALAIGVALFQFWGDWWWIVAVAVIFQVGQLVEGNILTPNLVGQSVGLHPVWLLFALSVFGALFGFVGLLVAVPLAAMVGVLVRFFVGQYLTGRLYQGYAGLAEAMPDVVTEGEALKDGTPKDDA